MILFDTHAHLDFEDFDVDRDDMIQRTRLAGVKYIVNAGYDLKSSACSVQLAQKYDLIYAAIGIHPHEAAGAGPDYLNKLEELAAHPKVVAIGEMGLDYYRDRSPRPVQQEVFLEQIALAKRLKKPIIIHDREAHGDMMDILRRERPWSSGGVLHCYSGSWEMARECLALGFYISIAGPVTFPKAPKLKDVAARVPADRLLVETDAPFLAPVPHRGRRNEPAYVVHTAKEIAGIRGMKLEDLSKMCTENGRRLFQIA